MLNLQKHWSNWKRLLATTKRYLKIILRVGLYGLLALILLVVVFIGLNFRSEIPVKDLEPTFFTAESSYIQVQDSRLHIRKRGSGSPVFLIHGSFASLHTWENFENELIQNNFSTISVDLPGHGLTGPNKSENYSTDYYASLLFALADSLAIDTFSVVGNSMGGNVALKMSLRKPDRITNLVLIDAAAFNRFSLSKTDKKEAPFIFKMLKIKPLAILLTRVTPRFLFQMNLKEVYGNTSNFTDKELDRYYYLLRREGNREATMKRLQNSGKEIQDSLQYIQTPTLIIWGEKDRWIPVAQAHQLNQAINKSQLVVFAEAGHIPMEEYPKLTANSVIPFLRNR